MSKIIHYDFRKAQRRKEMEEINKRMNKRLIAYALGQNPYKDEKICRQQKIDNQRFAELQEEEKLWAETGSKWVENLNKEKTE